MTSRAKGKSSTKGAAKPTSGKRVLKRGRGINSDSDAEDSEPQRQKRSRKDDCVTDIIDCEDGDGEDPEMEDDGDKVSNDVTE